MTYILEDRFKFKALYNGKIYDVKSFCDEYVELVTSFIAPVPVYICTSSHVFFRIGKTTANEIEKISLKDITKLLQCTGLKDKNGNLIYDGDILLNVRRINSNSVYSRLHEVKCEDSTLCGTGYLIGLEMGNATNNYIIGNIFDVEFQNYKINNAYIDHEIPYDKNIDINSIVSQWRKKVVTDRFNNAALIEQILNNL